MYSKKRANQNIRAAMLEKVEQLMSEGKNVRDACAQANVLRSQFYKWRSRRDGDPAKGLYDRSRRAVAHSGNITQFERERICELSSEFPREGCDRLKVRLESEGIVRSSTTIQRVLRQNGLGNLSLRQWHQQQKDQQLQKQTQILFQGARCQLLRLPHRRARSRRARLYESQRARLNPTESFLQGFYEVAVPAELIKLNGVTKLYLHFIFDFATELVWFDLKWMRWVWTSRGLPDARDATDLIQSGVTEAFRQRSIAINSIMTSDQPAFVERQSFPLPGTFGPNHPLSYSREVHLLGMQHMVIKEETEEGKMVIAYVLERLQAEFPDQSTLTYFVKHTRT